jgi:hypothetical protein
MRVPGWLRVRERVRVRVFEPERPNCTLWFDSTKLNSYSHCACGTTSSDCAILLRAVIMLSENFFFLRSEWVGFLFGRGALVRFSSD